MVIAGTTDWWKAPVVASDWWERPAVPLADTEYCPLYLHTAGKNSGTVYMEKRQPMAFNWQKKKTMAYDWR
jgi:hypothetical protein